MTELPSLENMSPDDWVTAMHVARDQVVGEVASVLDVRTTPREAAADLQPIFDEYRPEQLDLPFEHELAEGERAVVRPKEDTLIFWVSPTENYETIVYTEFGYWWFDHAGTSAHDLSRGEIHRRVAEHLIQLLPWANDDDLIELVAIEIASRAG